MNVYGQLIKASLEKVSSDLSETFEGLIWWNTTSKVAKIYNGSGVKTLVDTDTSQLLSNKEHDVAILQQQSTPGVNPASGKVKFYLKSDKRLYVLTETGAEKVVGDEQDVFVLDEQSGTPSTPSAGKVKLYTKSSDKKLYQLDSTGTETLVVNTNLSGDITSSGAVTTYNGTVPLNKGGTGQTTKAPAFDALSPMTTAGDFILGGASGTGTRLAKGTDGDYMKMVSGSPVWSNTSPATIKMATATYVVASGTAGGSSTGAAWNDRPLNTLVDSQSIITSLSSNTITLPAGTYYIWASAEANNVNSNRLRWRNTTDSTTTLLGNAASDEVVCASTAYLAGEFTIATSKSFKLQHYITTNSGTTALGRAVSTGESEVYATITIMKTN